METSRVDDITQRDLLIVRKNAMKHQTLGLGSRRVLTKATEDAAGSEGTVRQKLWTQYTNSRNLNTSF